MSARVCNLAAWFGAPDVGYQPYYGRRKRKPLGPVRVQLSRKKGWRLPPNTISVARPGDWGNPFRVGHINQRTGVRVIDRAHAVALYRKTFYESDDEIWNQVMRDSAREALRGKNLACWCPLSGPCHADVLLEIANR